MRKHARQIEVGATGGGAGLSRYWSLPAAELVYRGRDAFAYPPTGDRA